MTLGGSTSAILAAVVLGGLMSLGSDRTLGLMFWWRPFAADTVERDTLFGADSHAGSIRICCNRRRLRT